MRLEAESRPLFEQVGKRLTDVLTSFRELGRAGMNLKTGVLGVQANYPVGVEGLPGGKVFLRQRCDVDRGDGCVTHF